MLRGQIDETPSGLLHVSSQPSSSTGDKVDLPFPKMPQMLFLQRFRWHE
jgi:hypothetical protein